MFSGNLVKKSFTLSLVCPSMYVRSPSNRFMIRRSLEVSARLVLRLSTEIPEMLADLLLDLLGRLLMRDRDPFDPRNLLLDLDLRDRLRDRRDRLRDIIR